MRIQKWNLFSACSARQVAAFALLLLAIPAAARTVTDELGRTVNVPDHPHRLICLAPSLADDVYALGAGADVIAVSDYTKYPPETQKKPSIGLPLSPSMETIVAMHPDLVLGTADTNLSETIKQLERLNIPVFVVNPRGLQGIYKSLESLGKVLVHEAPAKNLVASLQRREAAIRRRVAGKPAVNLLMPIWYDPIMTIGRYAYINELIELAGGHSVTSDIPQEWPQISLEAVIARAPEALLLVRGSAMSMDKIVDRPGWQALPALRNHRVYYVGEQIEYPSPVAFDALEELAKELHP
jgi:iron complex transport system substrate-binding protein